MSDQDRPADPTEGVRIIGAEEAAEAMERGDVAARRADDEPRFGDRPPPPPAGPRPALRFPLDASADPTRIERPPVQPPPDPVTGPVELPHWTEPPTGEVPRVLITGDQPLIEEDADDLDAWSSFTTSAPRWRDADDDWAEDPEFVEALRDDEEGLGALQDPNSLSHEEYHSFDDLDERVSERRAAVPDAWGTEDDDWSASSEGHLDPAPADADAAASDWGDEWDDEAAADPAWADQPAAADAGGWVEGQGYADAGDPEGDDAWGDGAEDWGDEYDDGYDDDGYEYDDGAAVATARRTRPAAVHGYADEYETVPSSQDVATRAMVGGGLAAVALLLLAIGSKFFLVLVFAAAGMAAVELFNALRRVDHDSATLVGIVGCAAFPLAVYARGVVAFPLVMFLVLLATVAWFLVGAGGPQPRVVEGISATILGVAWIGGFASFAALMLAAPDGRALVLIAVFTAAAADIGGFFTGRAVGHRPLVAASPNKTVEGLLGGVAASVVLSVILVGILKLGPWDGIGPALLIGLAVGVIAPLGDISQSLVKRDLGIKDMGALLPGHGGVFDRVDGILFALPTVFWLVYAFGH